MIIRVLKHIVLLMAICFGCSCEKVQEVHEKPRFDLVLTKLISFRPAVSNNDVELSICVTEKDEKYLYERYILSIEMIYGKSLQLFEYGYKGTETYMDELSSDRTSLNKVCYFNEGQMDAGYYAYASFLIKSPLASKTAFRVKLHFVESGETYYTPSYTLVRSYILPDDSHDYSEKTYMFWLDPGVSRPIFTNTSQM